LSKCCKTYLKIFSDICALCQLEGMFKCDTIDLSINKEVIMMRKVISMVLAVMMLMTVIAVVPTASAATNENDFTVTDLTETSVEITAYTGSDTALEIPATINGKNVAAIGELAFASSKVTSVSIPATVNSVGGGAFANCTALTAITVDSQNKSFVAKDGVLFTSDKKAIVSYPAGKTNTSYTIPTGVENTWALAFAGSSKLQKVTIPSTLKKLGKGVFAGTGLKSVSVPTSITEIRDAAFAYCPNLTSVTLNNKVTTIGTGAFANSSALKNFTIPSSVKTISQWAFAGTGIATLTVPSTVTTIGTAAFGYDLTPKSYTGDPKNLSLSMVKISKATGKSMVVTKGSKAESYAKSNKISYKYTPASVKFSTSSVSLGVGEKYTAKVTISPANSVSTVKYTTSNSKVATVSSKGVVTAKKAGTAKITVTTSNGKKATLTVKVYKAPTKVTIVKTLTIKKGQSKKVSFTLPKNTYANSYTVKSSNAKIAKVAKVSAKKIQITGKKKGTATVTVKLYNGKTAKCKVTVK
jgi:hypothetical protein